MNNNLNNQAIEKIYSIYDVLWGAYARGEFDNCNPNALDKEQIKNKARTIGVLIFEIPSIRTNFISKALIDKAVSEDWTRLTDDVEGNKSRFTEEHFHPRQKSGVSIIQHFLSSKQYTIDDLITNVLPFCQVHLVLRGEDGKTLRKFQRTSETWTEAYKKAGIELVDLTDTEKFNTQTLKSCKNRQPTDLDEIDNILRSK